MWGNRVRTDSHHCTVGPPSRPCHCGGHPLHTQCVKRGRKCPRQNGVFCGGGVRVAALRFYAHRGIFLPTFDHFVCRGDLTVTGTLCDRLVQWWKSVRSGFPLTTLVLNGDHAQKSFVAEPMHAADGRVVQQYQVDDASRLLFPIP